MNPQGTSFIPQRPTHKANINRGVRKIYILTYVSYVLFFGSVLSAVGIFFYGTLLDSQLQAQKTKLINEKNRFSQADIASVRELDKKIDTAQERMDMHLSVPAIFDSLERTTVKSLSLKSFKYTRENNASPFVEVTGSADVFNSILFQRDVLASDSVFSGGTFTEVALTTESNEEEDGTVRTEESATIAFSLVNEIDPSLIQYSPQILEDANATQDAPQTESSTESSTEQAPLTQEVENS